MKISPVSMYTYRPTFKSYKEGYEYDDEFGVYVKADENSLYYDNPYEQNLRNYLRNHILENARISLEEDTPVTADSIEDVYIPNFKKLPNGSYRGASLKDKPEYVALLAKSGVECVVDLHGFMALAKACNENNLRYVKVDMKDKFWTNAMCKTDEELFLNKCAYLNSMGLSKREYDECVEIHKIEIDEERRAFVDFLAEIFSIINSNKCYIGCEFGDYRTTNFLALNYYFNPRFETPKIEPEPYITEKCRVMYENMTERDKKAMGITPKIEKIVQKRLGY